MQFSKEMYDDCRRYLEIVEREYLRTLKLIPFSSFLIGGVEEYFNRHKRTILIAQFSILH